MAIYELTICVISSNAALHTALRGKVPTKVDARIWAKDYEVNEGAVEDIPYTYISVRFNNSVDRAAVIDQINALADFGADCEVGSYIDTHKCYHDEGLPCDAPVRIWEKV